MRRTRSTLMAALLSLQIAPVAAQTPEASPFLVQPADDDIARYREQTGKDFPLISRVSNFSENGYAWRLVHYTVTPPKAPHVRRPLAPFLVVLHDNEDAAFDTMVAALRIYGGTAVAVETPLRDPMSGQPYRRRYMPPGPATPDGLLCQRKAREARYCDPNRNFGLHNPLYTGAILSTRLNWGPIIALHTNSPGYDGDGEDGRGNISLLGEGKALRPGAFRGQASDFHGFTDDDFILMPVQGPAPIRPDAKCGQKLVNMGINIWYEAISHDDYDGSLSHFAMRENLGSYYNIEVGSTPVTSEGIILSAHDRQFRMLNALMTYCVPLDR